MRRLLSCLMALWLFAGCTVVVPSMSNSPQDYTLEALPGEWEWGGQPTSGRF